MIKSIVLGGGCFWCTEAAYQKVKGVIDATNGYADGTGGQPTYELVSSGQSGYVEVVKVTYDSTIITLSDVLNIFWIIHDPTSLNRQGNDIGAHYRSTILYKDTADLGVINSSLKETASHFSNPVVTVIKQLETFYPAEKYHQNYFKNHPEQAYCQVVIIPKLTKLQDKMSHYLKD